MINANHVIRFTTKPAHQDLGSHYDLGSPRATRCMAAADLQRVWRKIGRVPKRHAGIRDVHMPKNFIIAFTASSKAECFFHRTDSVPSRASESSATPITVDQPPRRRCRCISLGRRDECRRWFLGTNGARLGLPVRGVLDHVKRALDRCRRNHPCISSACWLRP